MIIYVDIDNTICTTQGTDYINAQPIYKYIDIINNLFDNNHIVYWTSRGVGSNQNLYEITKEQLDSWGCQYHELRCDKPVYDIFIDDKTHNNIVNLLSKQIKLNRCLLDIPRQFNLYQDKKICLIGNGDSSTKYNINYDNYDLIVGINRIYQTSYWSKINVIYYNLSQKDSHNIEYLFSLIKQSNNFKYLIFCPWCSGPGRRKKLEDLLNKYQINDHIYAKGIVRQIPEIKKRPLTGIAALNHILLSDPQLIDLYGFDFYQNSYINNLTRYIAHDRHHNIDSNKKYLLKLLNNYPQKINCYY
jgi:hypothetical protein